MTWKDLAYNFRLQSKRRNRIIVDANGTRRTKISAQDQKLIRLLSQFCSKMAKIGR
jgi:hypothetical protein